MRRKRKKSKAAARKEKLNPETRELLQRIGGNARRLRLQRGWTVMDMTVFEFSERYWQYMEAGMRKLSIDYIAKIAKVFGVDVRDLLEPLDPSS